MTITRTIMKFPSSSSSSPSQWWWAWLVWWLPLLPLIYNSSNPGSVPKWKKRPMSQPKALIDEELPGTTGLVALKISLCVWWHWTWLIHTADCPALSLIFTFSDSKTCLKPSNAKCVNWFWSVYPKSILSPIASDLKFCCWCPEWLILEKSREKFCIDKCVTERKRRWFRTLIHLTKKHPKILPNSTSVEINELSVLCPEEFAIDRHNFSSSYAF